MVSPKTMEVQNTINDFFNSIDYEKPLSEYAEVFSYNRLERFMTKIIIFLFIVSILKFILIYASSKMKILVKKTTKEKQKRFNKLSIWEQNKELRNMYNAEEMPKLFYNMKDKYKDEELSKMLDYLREKTITNVKYTNKQHEIHGRLKILNKKDKKEVNKEFIKGKVKEHKDIYSCRLELIYIPLILLLMLAGMTILY